MKYLLNILFACLFISNVDAQEKHFVFIQSENKQPFYVSINGKIFSSSASGYVIVPKLTDGQYLFNIGFAQNAYPEQEFPISINQKDLGYNLKKLDDQWILFNLQSLAVTKGQTSGTNALARASALASDQQNDVISFDRKASENSSVTPTPATSSDSTISSASIGEPSVQSKPVVDINEPDKVNDQTPVSAQASRSDTTPALVNVPTGVASENPTSGFDTTPQAVNTNKISSTAKPDGFHLSFADKNGGSVDTIHVVIPTSPVQSVSSNTETDDKPVTADPSVNAVVSGSEAATADNTASLKFLDVDVKKLSKDSSVATVKPATAVKEYVPTNSHCTKVADEDDYFKLRKKLANETTDEAMIAEARKYYRSKCFTTEQIRRLSTLFLSDEGRLQFFEASYPSAADAAQYSQLTSEFIDQAYADRFKALVQ